MTGPIMENALLYVKNGIYFNHLDQVKYRNLETNEEYQNSLFYRVGSVYIPSEGEDKIMLVSHILGIYQGEIEKGQLLEKYRKWKNR